MSRRYGRVIKSISKRLFWLATYLELSMISLLVAANGQSGRETHPRESTGARPDENAEQILKLSPTSPFRSAASPVGQVLVELATGEIKAVCTGMVISPKLVLTALHCLQFKDPATGTTERFIPKNLFLLLDYLTWGKGTRILLNTVPAEVGGADLDYMILSAKEPIGLTGRRIPVAGTDVAPKQDLYIVHHPFGQPLAICRRDCMATEEPLEGVYFHHECDTKEISSGAPVLDTEYRLVGIHIAGGKSELPGTFNVGLRLSTILANSPTIANALKTYGKKNLDAGVLPPAPSRILTFSLPNGYNFVKDADGWSLSRSQTNENRIRLIPQNSQGDEYVLWDSAGDMMYRLPTAGGEVRKRRGDESTWTTFGTAVKK